MRAALTLSAATCYEDRLGQRSVGRIAGEMAWVEARELVARNEAGARPVSVAYLRLSRMPASRTIAEAFADALRAFVDA